MPQLNTLTLKHNNNVFMHDLYASGTKYFHEFNNQQFKTHHVYKPISCVCTYNCITYKPTIQRRYI